LHLAAKYTQTGDHEAVCQRRPYTWMLICSIKIRRVIPGTGREPQVMTSPHACGDPFWRTGAQKPCEKRFKGLSPSIAKVWSLVKVHFHISQVYCWMSKHVVIDMCVCVSVCMRKHAKRAGLWTHHVLNTRTTIP